MKTKTSVLDGYGVRKACSYCHKTIKDDQGFQSVNSCWMHNKCIDNPLRKIRDLFMKTISSIVSLW